MPFSLIVRSWDPGISSVERPSITFDGARIVIGRGASCDLRLPDLSVSKRHATLHVEGNSIFIVDERSTNGTFVDALRVEPTVPFNLRPGSLFRVGRIWLELICDMRPATRDIGAVSRELPMELVRRGMLAAGHNITPRIYVEDGPDQGLALSLDDEGRTYVIGTSSGCHLCLADPAMAEEQVHVVRKGGTVLVRDAVGGLFLGESPIPTDKEAVWKPALRLVSTYSALALHEPVSAALSAIEQQDEDDSIADEVIPLPKVIDSVESPGSDEPESPVAVEPDAKQRVDESSEPDVDESLSNGRVGKGLTTRLFSAYSTIDVAVVVTAIGLLALSAAGLIWILRR